jgi:hypothetical protein
MKSPIIVSRRKKLSALNMCAQGEKQKDVAYSMGVSTRTIQRAKKNLRLYGDIEGGRQKQGPKAVMTPDIINV